MDRDTEAELILMSEKCVYVENLSPSSVYNNILQSRLQVAEQRLDEISNVYM